MTLHTALAFDFGASSGRAILGRFDGEKIALEEIHRFSNDPVFLQGTLYWDVLRLFHEIRQGLLAAKHRGGFDSVGLDTWGVDFGLLDEAGRLLENPIHYRDARTREAVAEVRQRIPDAELYARTGIQFMNLNTIYQLYVLEKTRPELMERAHTALLMPDLFAYFLTDQKASEYSIASTTALLDPRKKTWDDELFRKVGIRPGLFPPVVMPGSLAGPLSDSLVEELGLEPKPVYRVTSHDTASAVVAVPAEEEDFIYLSSGTWSLMGIENPEPILTEESLKICYTNEGGYGGSIRYLKNIMGLWLIQESRRAWRREGEEYSFGDLERLALESPTLTSIIDADDQRFVEPGNLPRRIRELCRETGQPVPETVGQVVRVIYESLALKYRETKENIERVTGRRFSKLHVVGGGTQAGLLSQFTADATGIDVVSGPIEATALGNIAVQLMAAGQIENLEAARRVVRRSFDTKTYKPQDQARWQEAYERYQSLFSR